MKTSTFIELLENKKQIQLLEATGLKAIIKEFPYFQTARALYLKGLKNQDSFKYNNELKITAAYTTDRTVLFDFITSLDFNAIKTNENNQQITDKKTLKIPKKIIEKPILKSSKKDQEIKESLEIGKPLLFSSTENHSFNQWLGLSIKKPIVKNIEKKEEKLVKKAILIDKFIKNNPKIEPLDKDKKKAVPLAQKKQDSSLMTETLAKVYIEQKKYENAIQAYKILSLKYPKKSGFFAEQIKKIRILQKNKL